MKTAPHIKYKRLKIYKYELTCDYLFSINLNRAITTDYITINNNVMCIYKGYRWDGPSGPAIDTMTFMRASLIHDALYQLIREGYLGEQNRIFADKLMKTICLEDGMNYFRAWWCYFGVRLRGWRSTIKDT